MADKMNYIYSIIIPHYNIPELLVRCLKSIPVREDIQVIVVDDCSPDAFTYKERFPEIFSRPYLEWYSTPIGGSAGRARNIGLQHAKGKWILFADADDFFVPNMYELLSSHSNDDADVIFFMADSVDTLTLQSSDRHIGRNESIDLFLNRDCNCVEAILNYTVVWATIYSASLIKKFNLRFDEILCGNDIMFAVMAAHLCARPLFCKQILYVVTYRQNSLHDNKHKDYNSYVIHQVVQSRLDKYCKRNKINYRQPAFVLRDIYMTYKKYGLKAARLHMSLSIKDRTLLNGIKEYIHRKINHNL